MAGFNSNLAEVSRLRERSLASPSPSPSPSPSRQSDTLRSHMESTPKMDSSDDSTPLHPSVTQLAPLNHHGMEKSMEHQPVCATNEQDPFRCADVEHDQVSVPHPPDSVKSPDTYTTLLPPSVVGDEKATPSVHHLWDDCYSTFDRYPTPSSTQQNVAIEPCYHPRNPDEVVPTLHSPTVTPQQHRPTATSRLPTRRIVDISDREYYDDKTTKGSFKYMYDKWWTCWAIILVMIISTIVGINLFVLPDESNQPVASKSNVATNVASPTSPPHALVQLKTSTPQRIATPFTKAPVATQAPMVTRAPTRAPIKAPVNARIHSVVRAVTREPHLLDVPTSWPARAVEWLQTANLTPLTSSAHIQQRYALVLLDLALHNASTPRVAMPLSNECTWLGISCHSRSSNVTGQTRAFRPVTSIQWSEYGLVGSIPEDVALLTNLTSLNLADNRLVGSLPMGLYNLSNLEHMFLFNNSLEGSIATEIGSLTQLTKVRLDHNELTGTIPVEFGSIDKGPSSVKLLEWLSLRNNDLSGSLPDWNLPNVLTLDLGHNNLTGPVPSKWVEGQGSLQRLQTLHLDHNSLTGPLPKQWSNLGSGLVQHMYLNDNQLTGEVSGRYKNKTVLVTLHVQHNQFDKLSKDVCDLSEMEEGSLVDFVADCIICTCEFLCETCLS